MNLYLFNDNDNASIFGIGTYIKELIHALEDTTITIHIVHLNSVRPKFEIEKTGKVENWYIPEVRYDPPHSMMHSIQLIEEYNRNVIYLLRIHIKNTKDLIFHFNYALSYTIAKELKLVFDCKTVFSLHYTKWHLELHGNLDKLHKIKTKTEKQRSSFEQIIFFTNEYESAFFQEVDRVIAISQHMQFILNSEYQLDTKKISLIANGLEDIYAESQTNREILRRKWRISEKEFLILFAGRLESVKGLSFLLEAFRKVLEKESDCRLIIAGNGKYDLYLKENIDICTKVTFTGFLKKNKLYELYQIADIGVVPSLYEPFGYVAVEMMMHGLPIIATATSGLNEVVDEASGLKLPVNEYPDRVEIDTDLLADKIVYLLRHPQKAKQMGQNARQRYLIHYSSDVFRENMLSFYKILLNK